MKTNKNRNGGRSLLAAAMLIATLAAGAVQAQVPPDIEAQLVKIGHIVETACTAKLYRPLMPKNDYNTYWPPDAPAPVSTAELYPGVTIARDQSFGPNPKDVLDVFTADKGGGNRPVIIYVPGGGGNKIEQQIREDNAFYDNIGRWATKNGMVGVTVQRHPGTNWDDGGRDISMAVEWVHDNVAKYKGDPNRMVIWAQSAGNGPVGVYVGHPERWKNGVQVKAAIFMSGNPVPTIGGAGRGGGGGGRGAPGGGGAAATPAAVRGGACGLENSNTTDAGRIAGPSGVTPAPAAPAAGRGAGGGGGGRGRGALTPEQQAERDNLPGFKAAKAPRTMLAWGELDITVTDAKLPDAIVALHDELCKVDGPNAKDGTGHCPATLMAKGESHVSEVFSIDTDDKNVSGPVLAFVKKALK